MTPITVFLGGTCNGSTWRDRLIKELDLTEVSPFNPVVKDWTPECQARELTMRKTSDYVLYVITPMMTGVYSIAEAVDDSNKVPDRTLFCVLQTDEGSDFLFTPAQTKSLAATAKLIQSNGGRAFESLYEVALFLNTYAL